MVEEEELQMRVFGEATRALLFLRTEGCCLVLTFTWHGGAAGNRLPRMRMCMCMCMYLAKGKGTLNVDEWMGRELDKAAMD